MISSKKTHCLFHALTLLISEVHARKNPFHVKIYELFKLVS